MSLEQPEDLEISKNAKDQRLLDNLKSLEVPGSTWEGPPSQLLTNAKRQLSEPGAERLWQYLEQHHPTIRQTFNKALYFLAVNGNLKRYLYGAELLDEVCLRVGDLWTAAQEEAAMEEPGDDDGANKAGQAEAGYKQRLATQTHFFEKLDAEFSGREIAAILMAATLNSITNLTDTTKLTPYCQEGYFAAREGHIVLVNGQVVLLKELPDGTIVVFKHFPLSDVVNAEKSIRNAAMRHPFANTAGARAIRQPYMRVLRTGPEVAIMARTDVYASTSGVRMADDSSICFSADPEELSRLVLKLVEQSDRGLKPDEKAANVVAFPGFVEEKDIQHVPRAWELLRKGGAKATIGRFQQLQRQVKQLGNKYNNAVTQVESLVNLDGVDTAMVAEAKSNLASIWESIQALQAGMSGLTTLFQQANTLEEFEAAMEYLSGNHRSPGTSSRGEENNTLAAGDDIGVEAGGSSTSADGADLQLWDTWRGLSKNQLQGNNLSFRTTFQWGKAGSYATAQTAAMVYDRSLGYLQGVNPLDQATANMIFNYPPGTFHKHADEDIRILGNPALGQVAAGETLRFDTIDKGVRKAWFQQLGAVTKADADAKRIEKAKAKADFARPTGSILGWTDGKNEEMIARYWNAAPARSKSGRVVTVHGIVPLFKYRSAALEENQPASSGDGRVDTISMKIIQLAVTHENEQYTASYINLQRDIFRLFGVEKAVMIDRKRAAHAAKVDRAAAAAAKKGEVKKEPGEFKESDALRQVITTTINKFGIKLSEAIGTPKVKGVDLLHKIQLSNAAVKSIGDVPQHLPSHLPLCWIAHVARHVLLYDSFEPKAHGQADWNEAADCEVVNNWAMQLAPHFKAIAPDIDTTGPSGLEDEGGDIEEEAGDDEDE